MFFSLFKMHCVIYFDIKLVPVLLISDWLQCFDILTYLNAQSDPFLNFSIRVNFFMIYTTGFWRILKI